MIGGIDVKKKVELSRRPTSVFVFVVLTVMALSFVYPLFYMFMNSLKTKTEYLQNPFQLPKAFRLENYEIMFDKFDLLRNFLNTFFIAVISIGVIIVLSVFASYAFAKLHFKGSGIIYIAVICTMFIPAQVTMIPMYYMFSKFNLVDTYTGVILSYIAAGLPGTILLMTANFKGVPGEVIEAAKIDGAGYFGVIRHVVMPMGAPAIAINIVLSFVSQCNELFTPMILLQDTDKHTVIVALASLMNQTKGAGDPAFQFAGMFLAVIPPLVIYLLLQKHLTKGLTAGAIK